MTAIRIAIDVMGGDSGPPTTIASSIKILSLYANLHLLLVGDEPTIKKFLKKYNFHSDRLKIIHTTQSVSMDESPSLALRNKKDSSMRVAINLVKEGLADACVSAGNTGALMITARFVLKTLPGIDRPAIISTLPTIDKNKDVRVLDLGANVDATPESLVQFAVMGSVLAKCVAKIENPRVCLLNIGEEEIKGNELVKLTAQKLSTIQSLNFGGYIEGDQIFEGQADIVVCDGFVGNIALKTTEGVAHFISKLIKQAFMRNVFTKMIGLLAKPVLSGMAKRIDPDRYNGAIFIGLQGIVVKSHGAASKKGFMCAIEEAIFCVIQKVPEKIREEVEQLLTSSPPSE